MGLREGEGVGLREKCGAEGGRRCGAEGEGEGLRGRCGAVLLIRVK